MVENYKYDVESHLFKKWLDSLALEMRNLSEAPTMGWLDYNDLATQASPIALTAADTFYKLTNDGEGPNTNLDYGLGNGEGADWNIVTDLFDWTNLKLGDTVDIRVDVTVETSGTFRDIILRLAMAQGSGSEYNLDVVRISYKEVGVYHLTAYYSIYMGDTPTLNNGAFFEMSSDAIGTTVKVNGWFVRTVTKSG